MNVENALYKFIIIIIIITLDLSGWGRSQSRKDDTGERLRKKF